MQRENKHFHWTVLTVTNTHFKLIPYLWMKKLRGTLSKSFFYLFDLCLVILMAVEMFSCFSCLTDQNVWRKEGLFYPHLVVVVVLMHLLSILCFVLSLLRKAASVLEVTEGVTGTKHSQKQLDFSNGISLHAQFCPSFWNHIIGVLSLWKCGLVSDSCVTNVAC